MNTLKNYVFNFNMLYLIRFNYHKLINNEFCWKFAIIQNFLFLIIKKCLSFILMKNLSCIYDFWW